MHLNLNVRRRDPRWSHLISEVSAATLEALRFCGFRPDPGERSAPLSVRRSRAHRRAVVEVFLAALCRLVDGTGRGGAWFWITGFVAGSAWIWVRGRDEEGR